MAELRCVGATCVYGDTVAVDALDLDVADGSVVALLGASGAGKTSALRMIAGIEPVAAGRVFIGADDVTTTAPARRGVAMVFAGFSASERLTIADHITLPLPPGADASAAAAAVGLAGLDRRVKSLGPLDRQLLALARAIAVAPRVLLLDEPTAGLSDVDAAELHARFAQVQQAMQLTAVYATQDAVNAAAVAHRVVTLHRGVVQQERDAAALRAEPATVHAARSFDPSLNVRRARIEGNAVRYGDLLIPCESSTLAAVLATGLSSVLIGISPRAIRFTDGGQPVRIIAADEVYAYAQVSGLSSPDEPLAIAADSGVSLVGTTARIAIDGAQLFDPSTGSRIGAGERPAQ